MKKTYQDGRALVYIYRVVPQTKTTRENTLRRD